MRGYFIPRPTPPLPISRKGENEMQYLISLLFAKTLHLGQELSCKRHILSISLSLSSFSLPPLQEIVRIAPMCCVNQLPNEPGELTLIKSIDCKGENTAIHYVTGAEKNFGIDRDSNTGPQGYRPCTLLLSDVPQDISPNTCTRIHSCLSFAIDQYTI